ncbi:uncharacterized protein LOC143038539 [Oratosquilla oratoria]|uniref:uncharacterized protein LOC143038539 n=1 Tax=Oratosquilla oratoria TaxID=337810 RepID=UPI003F75BF25
MKKMSRSSGRSTRYPGMSTRNSGMSTRWTGCFQQELIERLWVALLSETGTSDEAEMRGGDDVKDDSEEESSDTEESSSTEDDDEEEEDDERGLIDDSVYQELIGAYGFSSLEDDSFKMPDSNTLFMMSKIRMDDNEKTLTEESNAKKKVGLPSTRHPRPTKTTSARQAMVQARVKKQGHQEKAQNQPASSTRAKPPERLSRSNSNSPHFSGSRQRQSRAEIQISSHKTNFSPHQPSSTKAALRNSDLADSKETLSSRKSSSSFSPSRHGLGKPGNQQLSKQSDSSKEDKGKGVQRSTSQVSSSCGSSMAARPSQKTRTPHFPGSKPTSKTSRTIENSRSGIKTRPDSSSNSTKNSKCTQESPTKDTSQSASPKGVSEEEGPRCSSDRGGLKDPSHYDNCKNLQPDVPSCSSPANFSKKSSETEDSPRCSPQALLSPEDPLHPETPENFLQSDVPKDSLRPETPLSPVSSVSSPSPNQELVSKVLVIPPLADGKATKTSEDVEEEGGRRADRIETCMEEALVQVLESLPQGWAQVPDHTAELVCSLTAVLEGLPRPLHAIAKVVSAVLRIHGRNPCLKVSQVLVFHRE